MQETFYHYCQHFVLSVLPVAKRELIIFFSMDMQAAGTLKLSTY